MELYKTVLAALLSTALFCICYSASAQQVDSVLTADGVAMQDPGVMIQNNAQDSGVDAHVKIVPFYNGDEVSFTYGRGSLISVVQVLGAAFGGMFSMGYAVADKISLLGCATVGYTHWFSPYFGIGADVSYEAARLSFKKYVGKDEDGNKIYKPGDEKFNHYFNAMPTIRGRWIYKEHFGFYSKLGAGGAAYYTPESSSPNSSGEETVTPASWSYAFAYQVTPVGLEFGGKNLRGYTELGFGYQGFFMLGVRYGF